MIELSPKELAFLAINTFKAQQKPEELTALIERLEILKPKVILEIGFGSGGTLWAFSKLNSVEHIISLDIKEDFFKEIRTQIADNTNCYIEYVIEDSMKTIALEVVNVALKGGNLDFLHIDGCHDYECVKSDYEMYSPLVREGGLIALHDVVKHPPETKCAVDKVWKEICESQTHTGICVELIKEPTNWGGYGLVYK